MNKNLTFTDKELRDISNFENIYEQIVILEREKNSLPYAMGEKTIKGYKYLYCQKREINSSISMGKLDQKNFEILEDYKNKKQQIKEQQEHLRITLEENTKYFRLSKANRVDKKVADILRKLDANDSLGKDVLVVGTNAFVAYEIHAQTLLFKDNLSTDDFDLTWYRDSWNKKNSLQSKNTPTLKLLSILKSIDDSYHINYKKPYQAINSSGYEVELLASPSAKKTIKVSDGFNPIPLMEQEWLLQGEPVRHILLSTDLKPAPIVAPDPRWMALHKIWLSSKPSRNPLKTQKDLNQGERLLELVVTKMKYEYPIDKNFISQLPKELEFTLDTWFNKNKQLIEVEKNKNNSLF